MPQQQLALGRLRIVLARREVKVGAVREGQGADRGRFVTNVDADVGEAGVEKGLHPLLDGTGRGWPLPRGLSVKFPGSGKALPACGCTAVGVARCGRIGCGACGRSGVAGCTAPGCALVGRIGFRV